MEDMTVAHYMQDIHKIKRLQLKQEKFRTKLHMHQKKVQVQLKAKLAMKWYMFGDHLSSTMVSNSLFSLKITK